MIRSLPALQSAAAAALAGRQPVQPAADFPDVMRVVHRCDAEYDFLQRRYKGTIVLG